MKESLINIVNNLENIENEINTLEQSKLETIINDDLNEFYNNFKKLFPNFINKWFPNQNDFYNYSLLSNKFDIEYVNNIGQKYSIELLKTMIDIYDLRTLNYIKDFNLINKLLEEYNDIKYTNFYNELIKKSLDNLIYDNEIFKFIKKEYINEETIKYIISENKCNINLLENIPHNILINNNLMEEYISKCNQNLTESDINVLNNMPDYFFNETICINLLNKAKEYNVENLFNIFPESLHNLKMWDIVLTKNPLLVNNLPDEKLTNISLDDYNNWKDIKIIEALNAMSDEEKVGYFIIHLKDTQKTERTINYMLENLKDISLLKKLIENIINLKIVKPNQMEYIIIKQPQILHNLTEKNIFNNISQEEYEKWLDDTIINCILENDIKDVILSISNSKKREKVWNVLFDKIEQSINNPNDLNNELYNAVKLSRLNYSQMTIPMIKRALEKFGIFELCDAPTLGVDFNKVYNKHKKDELIKWLNKYNSTELAEYKEFYEKAFIDYVKENHGYPALYEFLPGAITPKMYKSILDYSHPGSGLGFIDNIVYPNEIREDYIDLIKALFDYQKKYPYLTVNILSKVPENYKTDEIMIKAIQTLPKYLDNIDQTQENYDELINLAYKESLESIGRTSFSREEIELLKRFRKNNATLFSTLKFEMLDPKIINAIGEDSLEKIVRYEESQRTILEMSKDENTLKILGFILDSYKDDIVFIEPLIEKLSSTLYYLKNTKYIEIVSNYINNTEITEEEKNIISYITLNYNEAKNIENINDIKNFIKNKNTNFSNIINNVNSTLLDIKNTYSEALLGLSYQTVEDLVFMFGNDTEEILNYYNKEDLSIIEMQEKEALEIIIKLKSLVDVKDKGLIIEEFKTLNINDLNDHNKYKNIFLLETILRRAYGRNIKNSLNYKENNVISYHKTKDGKEYTVKKLNGSFNRLISVMDAYRDTYFKGDMYDRWNTDEYANNHALCFSFINEYNPGTALFGDKKSIIVSIKNIAPDSLTALAPYDLSSDFRKSASTFTYRKQKYYSASNLPKQMRSRYSELDIEIQDISEEDYKKIQIDSIICFEEIDEDSIQASIELSEKLGRDIPIELIDRRLLAQNQMNEINNLLDNFKKTREIENIEKIIDLFNSIRSAHMSSKLSDELLGETFGKENENALFNKSKLNNILLECIDIINNEINNGNIEIGIDTLEQLKEIINNERIKYAPLIDDMYEKIIMAGIDLKIDYKINDILRKYKKKKDSSYDNIKSIDVLNELNNNKESIMFDSYFQSINLKNNQINIEEFKNLINIDKINEAIKECKNKGFYNNKNDYGEEYITRVTMYAEGVAKLDKIDNKTIDLIREASIYHSCGRIYDCYENYGEYSAKLANDYLKDKYTQDDLKIILASIELQNIKEIKPNNKTNQYFTLVRDDLIQEKIIELKEKYNLNEEETDKIKLISNYIRDAVELDKMRFVDKANGHYMEADRKFFLDNLKNKNSRNLIKVSCLINEALASKEIEEIKSIVIPEIDYDKIIDNYYTERIFSSNNYSKEKSSISILQYIKDTYPEVRKYLNNKTEYKNLTKEQIKELYRMKEELLQIKEEQIEELELSNHNFEELSVGINNNIKNL